MRQTNKEAGKQFLRVGNNRVIQLNWAAENRTLLRRDLLCPNGLARVWDRIKIYAFIILSRCYSVDNVMS